MEYLDARKNPPQPGTILARYRANGFLESGEEKDFVLNFLINNPKGAEAAVNVLKNRCSITERSAVDVCLEIANDILSNKSLEEIRNKSYPIKIEILLYMKKEDIPDDPHWSYIKMIDYRDNFAK